MKLTTLCYIEKNNEYLMLHRVKKENDVNHDKWIGVGGKFEENETPEECLLREQNETDLRTPDYKPVSGCFSRSSDHCDHTVILRDNSHGSRFC